MRVLVIGSGAREHALVARLAGERDVADLVCAPGNPGIAAIARIAPVDISRPEALAALAAREQIDMTVVGPELPLSLGIVAISVLVLLLFMAFFRWTLIGWALRNLPAGLTKKFA